MNTARKSKPVFFAAAGLTAAAMLLASGVSAQNSGATPERMSSLEMAELLKSGEELYVMHCAGCHGVKGDGRGPAARWLNPKPRDFRDGVFKFRSTPSGALPTESDLMRVLTGGLPGTSMPAWHLLPERGRFAIVTYLKTFSPAWEDPYMVQAPISVSLPPADLESPEQVLAGRKIYEQMGCAQCHGDTGMGDGPSAKALDDQWGFRVHPANFVKGQLRGGDSPSDIYRTFTTGVNGTPMPAYKDDLTDEQRWALVAYVRSLRMGGNPHPADPAQGQ